MTGQKRRELQDGRSIPCTTVQSRLIAALEVACPWVAIYPKFDQSKERWTLQGVSRGRVLLSAANHRSLAGACDAFREAYLRAVRHQILNSPDVEDTNDAH